MSTLLRQHAEQLFAEELHELKKNETNPTPDNWVLSPQSVVTYLLGGKLKNGFEVTPKYIGRRRLMEIAVATLVTDRALLLYGLPGTAKSWVSEHLAAAISGNSTLIVQGTAGTGEEANTLWVELCPPTSRRAKRRGTRRDSRHEGYEGG